MGARLTEARRELKVQQARDDLTNLNNALEAEKKSNLNSNRIKSLNKRIVIARKELKKRESQSVRRATALTRMKRRVEATKKRSEEEVTKKCVLSDQKFGTRLPSDDKGAWSGTKGDSVWTPKRGGKPVRYKKGYPDFSEHAQYIVKIKMNREGKRTKDFQAARDQVRDLIGDKNWKKPKNMVWHHSEDGETMLLVPRSVHDLAQHSGGVSMITDPGY